MRHVEVKQVRNAEGYRADEVTEVLHGSLESPVFVWSVVVVGADGTCSL